MQGILIKESEVVSMPKNAVTVKKRIKLMMSLFLIGVMVLVVRLAWIQFVRGGEYKKLAAEQQTRDSVISAKRGSIYDRNMKVLAQSATAERVTLNPQEIAKAKNEDKVVKALVSILGVKESSVREQIARIDRQSVVIAKQVEKSTADVLRQKGLTGIHFEEDTKRYYPYGSLAAQVIGFTGSDGQGLEGLENVLDEQLRGLDGRIVAAKDVANNEMPYKYENYIEAQDGKGVVLTIDETIQRYTEKHLQQAYEENLLGNGGAAIVMNPKTGEILAMAVVPTYDLNEPRVITDQLLIEQLDDLELEGEAYDKAYSAAVTKMWRNKAVIDSYEPGSTFKTVVAAAALEEGVASPNDVFTCSGVRHVANRDIHCWHRPGHGEETFTQGLMNSCNPFVMELGSRLGADTFRRYFKAFGLSEKTGFTIPGESAGTFHDQLGVVDLATSSFGQTFTVTPLQIISAVSAIVNGGNLMKPYIVKAYTDADGKITDTFEPERVRNVISEETSIQMRTMMEQVVSEGTGKGGYVEGFRIGGKTGTSEKLPRGNGKYIASFVGAAPAEDPEIVCLLLLDEPNAGATGGGAIAAPAVGRIIEDVLPYLGYEPQYTEENAEKISVSVPNINGLTVQEALEKLDKLGLKINPKGSGEKVNNQIPAPGTKLHKGSVVIAYTQEEEKKGTVIVPVVIGMTYENARVSLENAGIKMEIDSSGVVENLTADYIAVSQSPQAESEVAQGTEVYVKFVLRESD
ncbi:MAG: PASTA domain-containing protein [Ruminococcaceae bacterium]|nr:PASTA domain-containing protein [Oscillospiraceae bacterium]